MHPPEVVSNKPALLHDRSLNNFVLKYLPRCLDYSGNIQTSNQKNQGTIVGELFKLKNAEFTCVTLWRKPR